MEKLIAIFSLIFGVLLFAFGIMRGGMIIELIGCVFLFLAIAFFDYYKRERKAAKQKGKR